MDDAGREVHRNGGSSRRLSLCLIGKPFFFLLGGAGNASLVATDY